MNDKREGKLIGYYEKSRNIEQEVNYINDKREGMLIGYYE